CSDQVHSSIDRAIWVAGIGQDNLVKIPTHGDLRGMNVAALRNAIAADRAAGHIPAGVIAATGATGMGACDDLQAVVDISQSEGLYTHLDAAWAGTAMICPEFRHLWAGADQFDSIVFNPHKWLGAQFDCAAHFLRDPDQLRQTLAIRPEYLKTHAQGDITDYSEWSIPLGRRFRALKLWFLMRHYGMEGLRSRIRNHVTWSAALCERLRAEPDFEIVTDPILSLWSFRQRGASDDTTQRLIDAINDDGRIYLTQTLVDGQKVIRFTAGQFDCEERDFHVAFDTITDIARRP
ncbi:MAG: pyridoxal-dependent decarboxylase, partial [Pseudomonadota bacterium]